MHAGQDELLYFESADVNSEKSVALRGLLEGGKVVLVNFWAIKCVPCIDELRELNRLYNDRLKGRGVEFIAVNADGVEGMELKKKMEELDIRIRFPSIADPDMEITNFYSNGFVPHNIIIAPEGVVELQVTGYNPALSEKIEEKLLELLGER
ncbi:MAG: redoxin domain-containing protein [Deltaproteobacteria bacterium]|nr:redoxin domain-containing protein [Deltaproteobacteria bacterium]